MHRQLAVIAMCSVLLAACGASAAVAPAAPAGLAGTYVLVSINGSALPYTILSQYSSSPKVEMLTGTLTVSAEGGFVQSGTARSTTGSAVSLFSFSDTGTVKAMEGPPGLFFVFSDRRTYAFGEVTDGILKLEQNDGMTRRYTRQ